MNNDDEQNLQLQTDCVGAFLLQKFWPNALPLQYLGVVDPAKTSLSLSLIIRQKLVGLCGLMYGYQNLGTTVPAPVGCGGIDSKTCLFNRYVTHLHAKFGRSTAG